MPSNILQVRSPNASIHTCPSRPTSVVKDRNRAHGYQGIQQQAQDHHDSLWRHQLVALADTRRCIALDLLAHGETEIHSDQDVSVTANATMLEQFLDALKIDQVDLVGNDSGGGIAQIFAANHPERVRSLAL